MAFHICCFTGHRHIPAEVVPELTAILDRRLAAMCEAGFTEFRTGGAIGFDTLVAQRVIATREVYPGARLHLILPCRDQSERWSKKERKTYDHLLSLADQVTYVQDSYSPGCMHVRNRALVEGSDLCLAYLTSSRGGTAYTCTYALKQHVRMINLANELS